MTWKRLLSSNVVNYLGKMLITLNEDEDDVTRGKFENLEVLISPLGRSCGLSSRLRLRASRVGFRRASFYQCVPLSNP
jgi:hypothetical protein